MSGPLPVQDLFGIPIAAVTLEQALANLDAAIAEKRRLQVGVVNAAKVVNMRRDEVLRKDVLASQVIFADGASIVWASRVLRRPLPERVAGIDLMMGLLRKGDQKGYRVYCLGATDEVLAKVVETIRRDFPNVKLVGWRNGYFSSAEEKAVAEDIAAAAPDVLFVAMTSPKKESFLGRWSAQLGVSVCHGVGGSFDVLAGKVRRAPASWQRLGLEWLYRVKQEPRRLWRRYLVTNTLFCNLVIGELFRQRNRRTAH